ncbi:MAG: ATP-binding protein [Rhizobiaceae bacterium]|uniref:ATP-binding protein n=1 Tax=unclassified Shinella TaxID=2643062 RepID=UPI00234E969D|nr:ATP-binding protein [Shinella sp. YE25]MCO5085187.1 ATP-binding protein [Rhizobiaceae bacterium]MDC7255738.1 AAA family ATPase [Shinella sp. YE25]
MLDTKLMIVFGVSGVGKTTVCAEYASGNDDVVHFSASALLRLHRETAGTRSTNEVIQDQHVLVDMVNVIRSETPVSLMLLDAHSLVYVGGHEVIIPADVIAAMKPDGLIFFKASGETISERRLSRGDTRNVVPQEIEKSQTNALRAAESYAELLPCRLLVIDASHGTDLGEAIRFLS